MTSLRTAALFVQVTVVKILFAFLSKDRPHHFAVDIG